MNKNQIRSIVFKKRKMMSIAQIEDKSKLITDKICDMEEYKKAKTVMLYYPIKNEVDTRMLIKRALKNKIVCLPYIEKKKATMTARKISRIEDLIKGEYGILSSNSDSTIVVGDNIDLIIVPMVAFDKEKHRIGFGGGYYDNYLGKYPNPFKCGVAFSIQEVDCIKKEKHDVVLDIIVTEN